MRYVIGLLFVLVFAKPTWADFQTAVDAYSQGDFVTAYEEFLPLADQGNMYAQYNLGVMYEYGEGVWQNLDEAEKWYKKAAEQGDPSSQLALALVLDDPERAYQWLLRAMSNELSEEKQRLAEQRKTQLERLLSRKQIDAARSQPGKK